MGAKIAQAEAVRQLVPDQLARGRGEQDLPAVASCEQARGTVEQRSDVVVAALLDHAAVERHTHAHRADRTPVPIAPQSSAASARCAATAALRAVAAVANTAWNASPTIL